MSRRQMSGVVAVIAAIGLSGCALSVHMPTTPASGPAASGAGATTTAASGTPAVTANEVATPPGPDERAPVHRSAVAAIRGFASTYINWHAVGLKAQLRRLAAESVGQARSAMVLAATQTAEDPELTQAGVANSGRVEAVSALPGGRGRYVVVTLESTTASNSSAYQGLAPAWHLAVATVSRRDGGWVISGWQPES